MSRQGIYAPETYHVELAFRNMQQDGLVFASTGSDPEAQRVAVALRQGTLHVSLSYAPESAAFKDVVIERDEDVRESDQTTNNKYF